MDNRLRHHLEGAPLLGKDNLVHGALPILRANHLVLQVRPRGQRISFPPNSRLQKRSIPFDWPVLYQYFSVILKSGNLGWSLDRPVEVRDARLGQAAAFRDLDRLGDADIFRLQGGHPELARGR